MNSKTLHIKNILNIIRSKRSSLSDVGVAKIGVFGSYLRGEEHDDSDLDMIIFFKPEQKTIINYFKALDILESEFHKKIDLLTPESISPYIKPYIDKEIVYEEL